MNEEEKNPIVLEKDELDGLKLKEKSNLEGKIYANRVIGKELVRSMMEKV